MAMNSGDSERGDADEQFASPRFSIAQLFELLLHIAQRSNGTYHSSTQTGACGRPASGAFRGTCTDEGGGREVPIATAAPSGSAAPETSDRASASVAPSGPSDPGDRRYWSNVSPGSSWMENYLPDYLPDHNARSSLSRDSDPTTSAVGVDADNSSPASTYHSSRASSPSPSRNEPAPTVRRSRDAPTTNTSAGLTRLDPRSSSSRLAAPACTSTPDTRQAATPAAAGPSRHRSSASIPSKSFAAPLATTTTATPVRFSSMRGASTMGPPAGAATRLSAAAPPAAAVPVVANAAPPALVATTAPAAATPAVAPAIATAPVLAHAAATAPVLAPAAATAPVLAPAPLPAVVAAAAPPAVVAAAAPPTVAVPAAPAAAAAAAADGPSDPNQVWYVVTCGRRVGVFDNHSLVVWSVTGVRGNASRSFGTREEAERAFQDALDMNIVREV
ncbi:uncharacterized protein TRAVEDRAFT_46453 [Trametes versicolor FP-101664 SS1]|uniref:uncharacterized protein n=1 Tax=Trametes versicolor (strain FP-101664) TaxID=717944 RepID=UPI0004623100|nr:uncharacterized protein TRAVEDRAFT_46453 [Trametes versicolor FP-101664 SS1]EIW59143.1 hypothetical protein TRAVEDRAFT_46453 [Trametes versicolor FP-101664 SS1]